MTSRLLTMNPDRPISRRGRPSGQRLGQHFLTSVSVLEDILSVVEDLSTLPVLEVGPGEGALTRMLAKKFPRVIAVEKDERLAGTLAASLKKEGIQNVTLITGDILERFPDDLPLPKRYVVIANIPYYLTGRLIRALLESAHRPETMVLMVQREVAERITATPPHMNLLGLSVQAYGTPRIALRVPASAFTPPPKVDSAVIRVDRISDAFFGDHAREPSLFFALLHAAFGGKRKILANSIATLAGSKTNAATAIAKAALPANARPETLTLADWARLLPFI